MGRIWITGDKHGTLVPLFGLAEKIMLKNTDILLIAGDAGYVWDKHYCDTVATLQQIFPGTIAFVDGNHENHQLLNSFAVSQWQGGRVHQIGERVYHLLRGELYTIYGMVFFTFGGARSVDKDRREAGKSWWQEEEPTEKEIEYGRKQMGCHVNEIDYVITHECPLFARAFLSRKKEIAPDYRLPHCLEQWYHIVSNGKRFQKWYFGHMHTDQLITPKLRGVHHDILPLGEEAPILWR